MQNRFKIALKYLLVFILVLTCFFVFINFQNATALNLLVTFSTILAFLLWSKQKKLYWRLILPPFILSGTVTAYFFIHSPFFLPICLILILFILGSTNVFLNSLDKESVKVTQKTNEAFMIAILISTLIPLLYNFSYRISLNHEITKNIKKLTLTSQQISQSGNQDMDKVRRIAQDPFIRDFVINKPANLPAYCQNIVAASGLSYFIVTDSLGNVVARSHKPDTIGDNIFTEINDTKTVFGGNEYQRIGLEPDFSIAAVNGVPIKDSGKVVGALFAGKILNDSFLSSYVTNDNNGLGLFIGNKLYSTFSQNPDIPPIFRSSSLANELSTNSSSAGIISHNNHRYLLASKTLDLAGSPRIVFLTPESLGQTALKITFLLLGLVCLAALLVLKKAPVKRYFLSLYSISTSLKQYLNKNKFQFHLPRSPFSRQKRFFHYFTRSLRLPKGLKLKRFLNLIFHYRYWRKKLPNKPTTLLVLPSLLLILIFVILDNAKSVYPQVITGAIIDSKPRLDQTPSIALKLSKNYLQKNETAQLKIYTQANNQKIDSMGLSLKFTPEITEVTEASEEGSICQKVTAKNIDNDGGSFDFSCNLATSQNSAEKQLITALSIRAKDTGISNLSFDSIYTYFSINGNQLADIKPGTTNGDHLIVVDSNGLLKSQLPLISIDYPDPSKWYSKNMAHFTWLNPKPDSKVRYCLSKAKQTCDSFGLTSSTEISQEIKDGIWYFNAIPQDPALSYLKSSILIKIDSTPPEELKPLIGPDNIELNLRDATSGIQKSYYSIDGGESQEIATNPLPIPKLSSGSHIIKFEAMDNAGNRRSYDLKINGDDEN